MCAQPELDPASSLICLTPARSLRCNSYRWQRGEYAHHWNSYSIWSTLCRLIDYSKLLAKWLFGCLCQPCDELATCPGQCVYPTSRPMFIVRKEEKIKPKLKVKNTMPIDLSDLQCYMSSHVESFLIFSTDNFREIWLKLLALFGKQIHLWVVIRVAKWNCGHSTRI